MIAARTKAVGVCLVAAMAAFTVYSQQQEQGRTPLSDAVKPGTSGQNSNLPIEFQSRGLDYEALTKEGITVMFAQLPHQLKEFHILQVTVTNGSLLAWTVKPVEFTFTRPDGTELRAMTADEVVSSLLDKATRNDVIKLQLLYENTIYALANYRPTNGYEQRREAAFAQFVNMKVTAAAAASAIAMAPVRLKPGDSTDGAIFFENKHKEKGLGAGVLTARTCGQVFQFQLTGEIPEAKVR